VIITVGEAEYIGPDREDPGRREPDVQDDEAFEAAAQVAAHVVPFGKWVGFAVDDVADRADDISSEDEPAEQTDEDDREERGNKDDHAADDYLLHPLWISRDIRQRKANIHDGPLPMRISESHPPKFRRHRDVVRTVIESSMPAFRWSTND